MGIAEYIRAQPDAVRLAASAARGSATQAASTFLAAPGPRELKLIGSGSSRNALLTAAPTLARTAGGPVAVRSPEEFLRDPAGERCRVIVLSQSGTSRTSIAAAQKAVAEGLPTLVITAAPDSAISRVGGRLLVLPIGEESIGPKTKGFAASLAALFALAGVEDAALPLDALIEDARKDGFALAQAWPEPDCILVTGRGALHGIALEASLKLAEIAGVPTSCYPWEEVLHGRLHGLSSRSLALVIADTADLLAEARHAASVMRGRGVVLRILNLTGSPGPEEFASPAPALPAPWNALAALFPFQWFAVALALARGMAPEAMRYPGLSADLAIKVARPG